MGAARPISNYTFSCSLFVDPSGDVMHLKQIGQVGNGDAATTKGYHVNSTAPLRWRNKRDVEFVFTHSGNPWTESRCTVDRIEANGSSAVNIFLSKPCWTAALSARKVCYPGSGPCVPFTPRSIENVLPEATPTPASLARGSWYCDRKEHAVYGHLDYRTAARNLFLGPYLAHFCSFFRRFFAVSSVLTPGFQKVAPKDRGAVP